MRSIKYLAILILVFIFSCTTDKYPSTVDSDVIDAVIEEQLGTAGTIDRIVNGQKCAVYYNEYNAESKLILAPDSVIKKVNDYLASIVGNDYAAQNFSLHSVTQTLYPRRPESCDSCYFFYYEYKVIIGDYCTVLPVMLKTDLNGVLVHKATLPDRIHDPSLGMPFAINDSIAVLLAQNDGLPGSMEPWEIRFSIITNNSFDKRYVWRIYSYQWGENSRRNSVSIDAVTGENND